MPKQPQAVEEHEFADDHHDTEQQSEQLSAQEYLRQLDPGAKIAVHRLSPSYAKGYLGMLTVGPSGIENIEEELMSNYGGGTFRCQGRVMAANPGSGKKPGWARGCAIVEIAGEPMKDGRRYVNGVLEAPPMPSPLAPQIVSMQQPNRDGGGLDATLLGLLQSTLNRAASGDGAGIDLAGLGALITSVGSVMGGQTQSNDPMSTLERAFGMVAKIQKMGGSDSGGSSSGDGDDMFGGAIGNIIMQKLLGGSQAPAQPQYPPQYGQNQGQVWQSHPQYPPNPYGPPPGYPPAPPNGGNWNHPQNGVAYQQPVSSHAPTTSPQPAPSAPAPETDGMGNESEAETEGSGDEGVFTVDHLEEEMRHMSKPERDKFVADVMGRLGLDQALGQAVQAKMAQKDHLPTDEPAPTPAAEPLVGPGQQFPPFNIGAAFEKG